MPTPVPAPIYWVDLGPECAAAGIRAGFTSVAAGNLALDVGDDPALVLARRAALASRDLALGVSGPTRFAHHVHGTTVRDASNDPASTDSAYDDPTRVDPNGDAWVTASAATLAVYAADCLPVLLVDPRAHVIAAAHAGRAGLLAGVLDRVVAEMRARGAKNIRAVIGPAICGRCYEVPADMAASAADYGLPPARTRAGTPSLNLPAIAMAQLTALGVAAFDTGWCTLEDPRFFSHRGTRTGGPVGRHAGIIHQPRPVGTSVPVRN